MDRTISLAQVGPQGGADTQPSTLRADRQGAQVVTDAHGKYYESNSRSKVFIGTSASAGIAILLPATGGGHPTLWNPLGSGVNVSIIQLRLSYVSGTHAPGAFEWAYTANAGAAAATGSPIATATLVAPVSMLVGSGAVASAKWSPTTNTFTAAPVFFAPIGVGLHSGASATAINPSRIVEDYDGSFVLAPGAAMSLCYQTTTTTALFQVGVTWEEVPV